MFGRDRIELKSPDQIAAMRRAGLVVASTLELLADSALAGVTTGELDRIAREHLTASGATSNFLNYGADPAGRGGFSGVVCTSVNDQVVHGVPGDQVLRTGDLVSLDFGAVIDGWHGDAAITVAVGTPSDEHAELMRVTDDALWAGIAAMTIGGRIDDISAAIEDFVTAAGDYGITEGVTGHGIGTAMHQPPWVPNVRVRGRGAKIVEGLVLAIEPMVTLGASDSRTLDDDWTIVTTDGSWAAHFEHTVAATQQGLWVLTAPDGGEAKLAELGVGYGGPT